ncbi:DUF4126 family protein [Roseitranquillus sediminis]|uniref:DUF4126 family protein n=1 Tax=Roseitranquillus sediminis TaxID=2809051 RepID=UPI001D0C67E2|nr:DUF4126 family protein [Roseitranquillus sediminis]MBM9594500.1 DUF4126 family protein [Roseitranquillus sediminis]
MAVIVPFLIGVVAGLRTMTAPAAIAWAGWLGWLELAGTWAAFLASPWAVGILSALALGEFVTDQLPSTPSRKVPVQLAGRVASGAFSGAALGAAVDAPLLGFVAGAVGAVAGAYGGATARARMSAALSRPRPAALIEDAVAIVAGLALAAAL